MKILIVADHESRKIWDFFEPGMLDQYDLILSAGDLHPHYMSFLATMCKTEVLYVHGNHDDCYEKTPPEGCICIDGAVVNYKGLRILGLGGSMRYKNAPQDPSRAFFDPLESRFRHSPHACSGIRLP